MGRYEFIVTIVTLSCTMNVMTGWWFQKMILSSWEDVHFDEYFAIGVKPPTRKTFEI